MPAIFPVAPIGVGGSLIDASNSVIECIIPEDVEGLNKLLNHCADMKKMIESGSECLPEEMKSQVFLHQYQVLEGVFQELCDVAAEANPKDPGRMVERAKVLAYKSCGNLYCLNMRQNSKKPLGNLCSGCELVRYCSARCQKADWKCGHKIACKSIQAAK